jgi:aerobic C4-dicarboxylate transport protein
VFDLSQLVPAVNLVSIFFVIVVLGLVLKLAAFNIWSVLAYFRDEILLVFAATSAETIVPRSMEKRERLVTPTGFTFNMDGTAIYMSIGILFLAHTLKVHLTVTEQFATFLVKLFTSKGGAGVTGGGFRRQPRCRQSMAEIRAATNLTSNAIATLVVARCSSAVDCDHARQVLGGRRNDQKLTPPVGMPAG